MSTFRILSIDGGGIKGLYSAVVLQIFEEHFESRIIDHFDLICGTSTGAIIASGLASGYSAKEMADFYYEKGPKIFQSLPFLSTAKQFFLVSKYQNTRLKSELKALLGTKQFKDSPIRLCIPAFDLTAGYPYVFKTDHAPELSRDGQVYLWRAALASSAAPTYFPIYQSSFLSGHKFVDGAAWANNPSMVGFVEALRYFVGPEDQFQNLVLISVSSISDHFAKVKLHWWNNSIIGWNKKLIDLFMAGQTESTEQMVEFLTNAYGAQYLRIPSPNPTSESMRMISLDNANRKVLDHIVGLGKHVATRLKNNEIIQTIFETKRLQNQ